MKPTIHTPFRSQIPGFLLLLFLSVSLRAQTLRGTVREYDGNQPITGATVNLYPSKSGAVPLSLATSPSGEFMFENLRAGYYRCEIVSIGHESVYLTEIPVSAGKEQVLDIQLRRSNAQLPEITIAANLTGRRAMQPMSEILLTRDQTLRFPAMFFDPGRLAAAYPGVSQTDDGTNMMSIRGNSPASVRWRLEGLDIVNPNHLPNAGTQLDAPASASGGVLMFSAQMLDNSSLLTGAFPAGYGDAIGGVMDMNLRTGNKRQHEFTVQAGLVGLDVAAEGPLKKGSDNSYLVNYRYSTVGLLGQLGVSFGDEQINFQDLSYNLHFKGKKGAQYSIFGLGGLSENKFRHKEDTAEIKYDKDKYDIDFKSRTGVAGASGRWNTGDRSWLKAALVYSVQTNDWHKKLFAGTLLNSDERVEERIAGSLEWHLAYRYNQFAAGLQTSRLYYSAEILRGVPVDPQGPGHPFSLYYDAFSYVNMQPWLRWDWTSRNGRWNSQLGGQFHYVPGSTFAPAPRGMLSYHLAKEQKLSVSAGLYKQDAPLWLQYERIGNTEIPRTPYMSSFQAGLRYTWTPALFWKFSAELFHQLTDNIAANGFTSVINAPELIIRTPLAENSQARNNGVEVGVERNVQKGWFFAANATVFKSQYRIEEGEWLDSRWDIGHLANVTFGKEWQREKSANTIRTIGVGLRGVLGGGPREANIDLLASQVAGATVLDESRGYYRRNSEYFRVDIRVYWKRSLGDRRNSTFALDIQNISGQENLSYRFYDPFTGQIENKYQLGAIPNFSWRLEF